MKIQDAFEKGIITKEEYSLLKKLCQLKQDGYPVSIRQAVEYYGMDPRLLEEFV